MSEPAGSGASDEVGKNASCGGFFAIDGRVWAKVNDAGMNQAIAYLVLACGVLGPKGTEEAKRPQKSC